MSIEQLISALAPCSKSTASSMTHVEYCSTVAVQVAGIWPQRVIAPGPMIVSSWVQAASLAEHADCSSASVGELFEAAATIATYLQPVRPGDGALDVGARVAAELEGLRLTSAR